MEKRTKSFVRIIIIVLILVLFTAYAIDARLTSSDTDRPGIRVYMPWGLIAIFISLYIFYESNRLKKTRREERREYMNEHHQDLLDRITKKEKKPDENEEQKPD